MSPLPPSSNNDSQLKSQLEYFQDLMAIREELPSGSTWRVAVASGKGGVGKTNFSLNLAMLIAQHFKVLLLDGDPGLADLHLMMGVSPKYHWGHYLDQQVDFEGLLMKDVCGLDFIHGFSGIPSMNWIQSGAMERIIAELHGDSGSQYDAQVIDVGAGLSESTIALTTTVNLVILIITPELTSLADAYSTLKTIKKYNPQQEVVVCVNQAQSEAEAIHTHQQLCQVSEQFLGIRPRFVGFLPKDPNVPKALMQQKPILSVYPQAPYVEALRKVLRNLRG